MADNGISAYASLGDDINKKKGDVTSETKEGVVSPKLPELALEMSDDDLLKLLNKWEKVWKESPAKADWEKQCDENEKYWRGKHHDLPKSDNSHPIMDNLIFESLETYLPQVTRRNPEPIVTLAATEQETPENLAYVEMLKKRLADIADVTKLRLKLKTVARHWAIFKLGAMKFGWDIDKNIPIPRAIRPKKLILDPEATISEDGYTGNRIGEYRKMESSLLLKLIEGEHNFTESKKAIDDLVKDDLGTDLQFIEWWTDEYTCWKMGSTILLKKKNLHWNYEQPAQVQSQVDSYGNETQVPGMPTPGSNHFTKPEMPYDFLSVFSLGEQPMDSTSLIEQNLANQDQINKRNQQIDKNADDMNGGMVVSLGRSGLTQSQAEGVTNALRKGKTVVIPDGAPREAVDRYPANGLPADVYNDLVDKRQRLRDVFGVSGSSQAGLNNEDTVRGKIMSRGFDTDRIGGGVSEYLEQLADDVYNWLVQLLYVYDETFIAIPVKPKVVVSVKEGSLLPKDSMSIANQAIELATANKMSLVDLYKKLEYPNPEELAANVWLELNAPQLLYRDNPLVQEAIMMQQQAAQAQADAQAQQSQQQQQGDAAAADQAHQNSMQKEAFKGDIKMQGDKQRSMLAEVPQNSVAK